MLRGLTLERAGRRILDGVDLDIAPGERVALTGASGAGKSTLADVLVGFAEPSAGQVRTGGVDLEHVDGAALRETVRWTPQDPHIFATTIAANVRIAAPDADDATLEAALRAVGAGPWLDALPDGLATRLGEFGERCSGGERQRIGLARAYLCGGGLVVLDEPASHLPHDEALTALSAVMDAEPGRGVLLITHRRDEVALAGREIRLEGPLSDRPTAAARLVQPCLGCGCVALEFGGVSLELLLLELRGPLHGLLDLCAHVGDGHHHEACLAGVEVFSEFLEVVPAHARRRMTGERTEERPAGGRARQ